MKTAYSGNKVAQLLWESRLAPPKQSCHLIQLVRPLYIPRRNENTCLCKNTHTFHSSTTHDPNGWEQPKCLPTNDWISKTRHFPAVEYYSVISRMTCWHVLQHRWALKSIMSVKEVRHTLVVWLHTQEMSRRDKSTGTESTLVVAWSCGVGGGGMARVINLNRFMTKATKNASYSTLWTPEEKNDDIMILSEMRFKSRAPFLDLPGKHKKDFW